MSELYSTIGTRTYANLLADPQGADVIAIPCKPGNGEVAAGTVMYREASGRNCAGIGRDGNRRGRGSIPRGMLH